MAQADRRLAIRVEMQRRTSLDKKCLFNQEQERQQRDQDSVVYNSYILILV